MIHVVIAIEIIERTHVGFMWFGSVLTSKEMTAQTFIHNKKKKKVIVDIYYLNLKVTYINIVHLNEQL